MGSKYVYGWVSQVAKRLPYAADDDRYLGYNEEDFDWQVTIIDTENVAHDFAMSWSETHPMPFLGKWVEALIETIDVKLRDGKIVAMYPESKRLIERE